MKYSWRCHCCKQGKHWLETGPNEVHFVHAKDIIQAQERFAKKFPEYTLLYVDVPNPDLYGRPLPF